ncbi:MAG: Flp pilus assembly protein CpaB, partial [Alphaproteobacteria bacterium]|nr:Flp pilus assembly protein CpaB [Alphaproteobacteria bacterium]
MKMRAIWILALALIMAAFSVYMAKGWLDRQARGTAQAPAPIPTVNVVVAKVPLPFGATIRKEQLRLVQWPKAAAPEGTFGTFAEILGESGAEDRVALRPIEANEPLMKSKVSGFGGRASLSALVSPDMRAATIRINDVRGVAGFILPGDRVDVLLTREISERNPITDILLQNLKVLAIDQDANEAKDRPSIAKAATLEVTPEQAQKLVLAQQVGVLSLALRHIANAAPEKVQTIGLKDLRIGEANEPAPQPEKKVTVVRTAVPRQEPGPSVRITRGTQSTNYELKSDQISTGILQPPQPAPQSQMPATGAPQPIGAVPAPERRSD